MRTTRSRTVAAASAAVAFAFAISACGGSGSSSGDLTNKPANTPNTHKTGSSTPSGSTTTPSGGTGSTSSTGAPKHTTSQPSKAKPVNQTSVLSHLPGKPTNGCVIVGTQSDVRSGAIAMGNFAQQRAAFTKDKGAYDAAQMFFYVIPQDTTGGSATVTFAPVSGGGKAQVITSKTLADAGRWKYYPIHVTNPPAGTYRVTASAGTQHGCFIVSFKA